MADITIRNLREDEIEAADHIVRLAFGTFLQLPDPMMFGANGSTYAGTRWRIDREAAFAAEIDGRLVGSNFAALWGSVGFFGPLTVEPALWDKGIASKLMEPIMQTFESRSTTHQGLFTFPQSPKHIHLYQKFGFWPRYLTAVMSKPVAAEGDPGQWSLYSQLREGERAAALAACREITEALYEGLDTSQEIAAIAEHGFGDTVLVWDNDRLAAFAMCHCGRGSEAGEGVCYVKFAAVRPDADAKKGFHRLLLACDAFAAGAGLTQLIGGANMARQEAYSHMLEHKFRTQMQGVAMQRPNEPAYNRPGVYLIDDWR